MSEKEVRRRTRCNWLRSYSKA